MDATGRCLMPCYQPAYKRSNLHQFPRFSQCVFASALLPEILAFVLPEAVLA